MGNHTPPRVIGLMGAKRAGKDTVAARLASPHGYKRIAHADALKRAAYLLNPLVDGGGLRLADLVDSVGWEAAKSRPEVRRTLQRMGQAIRASIDEDVWARVLDEQLRDAAWFGGTPFEDRYPPVVISDVRLPNEVMQVRYYGGVIVRVGRPSLGDPTDDPLDQHISERALDDYEDYDYTLINDGTVEDLHKATDRMLEVLRN